MLEEPRFPLADTKKRLTAKSLVREPPPPKPSSASARTTRVRQQKRALVKLAKIRFSRSTNRDTGFRQIIEVAARCLNASQATLWLFSPDRQMVRCHHLFTAGTGHETPGTELEVKKCPHYFKLLKTQRTAASQDAQADIRLAEFWDDFILPNNIGASIDAAIRLNGEVVGVVCVAENQPRKWTSDEEQFVGSLADIAALVLKEAELRREEELRKAFADLGKKLNACTTPQMAVRLIGKTAQMLWGWDALFLHLYDAESNRLLPVLNIDTINGRKTQVPFNSAGATVRIKEVMSRNKLLLNGELPPKYRLTPFGNTQRPSQSRMYTTIRHKNSPLAILSIQSYSPDAYDEAALDGLEALAEYCTGAIARLQAETLRKESDERFRGLAEATTEGILIHSATRIFEVNAEMSRIFGYTATDLKQRRLTDLLSHISHGKGGGPHDATGCHQDGRLLPLEIVTRPCRYQGKPAKVTVIRDISERKRIEQKLREHSRQILEAQENERFRVSRDLHDSVNQVLTAARLNLETLTRSLPKNQKDSRGYVAKTQELLAKAMEEIRLISWNLRPNELDDAGLPVAIRTLCSDCQDRTGIAIRCHFPEPLPPMSPEIAVTLFRIVQEALNNACRHSAASRVDLQIAYPSGAMTMEMTDDGVGFSPGRMEARDRKKGGLGLTNMRERALAVGGTFELESAPGKGTSIRLTLPLDHQASNTPMANSTP